MTMPTLLGSATVVYGGQATISGYIVLEETDLPVETKETMIENAAGQDVGVLLKQTKPGKRFRLMVLTGAVLSTDFPQGLMCTLTTYSNLRVRPYEISETSEPQIVTIELRNEFNVA